MVIIKKLLTVENNAIYEATHVTKFNKNLDEYEAQQYGSDPYYKKCVHLIEHVVMGFGWSNDFNETYFKLTNKKGYNVQDVVSLVGFCINRILTVN